MSTRLLFHLTRYDGLRTETVRSGRTLRSWTRRVVSSRCSGSSRPDATGPRPSSPSASHVTTRTVRRDVDRLRELGYPVNAMSGPGGGYQLGNRREHSAAHAGGGRGRGAGRLAADRRPRAGAGHRRRRAHTDGEARADAPAEAPHPARGRHLGHADHRRAPGAPGRSRHALGPGECGTQRRADPLPLHRTGQGSGRTTRRALSRGRGVPQLVSRRVRS